MSCVMEVSTLFSGANFKFLTFQIEKIFTSSVVKDVETLKQFRNLCLSSDYAATIVDKAIDAYKIKSSVDRLADPFEALIKQSEENKNNLHEVEEDDDDGDHLAEAVDLVSIVIMKLLRTYLKTSHELGEQSHKVITVKSLLKAALR